MSTELRRARTRQMFIFLLVGAAMLGLLGRLYYWQVVQSGHLSQLANAEHIQNLIVDAPRGLIYDAQGRLLATNVVRDDVYIEPVRFFTVDFPDAETAQGELALLVQKLHSVLPDVAEDKLLKAFNSGRQTVRIAGPIKPEQSKQLRELHLPDTFLEPRTWRIYPGGDLAAQILGFVQPDKGGVYGIESQYNSLLAGKAGSFTAETDLNGNPLTVGSSTQRLAIKGANLTLTIDSSIQYYIQTALVEQMKAMGAQSGTVVVLNARTGAVVAMGGAPTFDPNHYGDYADQMGCLNSVSVFFNPALKCTYEPGSTMKAVTMTAALDQGLITPSTTLNDPGYLTFKDGTAPVTNWNYQGYGVETMTQVLEHSANVGAAYVAHDILGPDRYYPYLANFGFGKSTGIDGPEEAGFYRTPASQGWTPSDLARQAFGQSISATPFQVAMAYQAIANGGVMMKPYLVAAVDDNGRVTSTQPQMMHRVMSTQTAQMLAGMLTQVAIYNHHEIANYSIAIKTGTATTVGVSEDLTEASMVGFVPATNPQYVILVKLDRPQSTIYGGGAAGPLWKAIAQQLMWHFAVPPDQQN